MKKPPYQYNAFFPSLHASDLQLDFNCILALV
jgi:hypothetical protein